MQKNSGPHRGPRRKRMALAVAVAALATMAFGAGSAKADSFGADFDNAFLKIGGVSGNGLNICCETSNPPDIIELDGTTPPSSSFTVPPGGVTVPQFSGVLAGLAYVEVDLSTLDNINGTMNTTVPASTTVSTTNTQFLATMLVDLTDPEGDGPDNDPDTLGDNTTPGADGDTCVMGDPPGNDDGPVGGPAGVPDDTPNLELAFNTTQAYPSPFNGDPFTYMPLDLATDALDNGAIVATWPDLPDAIHTAGPDGAGDDCGLVSGLTAGRGALWLGSELATPALNTAPPDTGGGGGATTPTKPKCKKGQKLKKVKGKFKCVKKKKKKK